jgi:hypothetical protein
MDYTKDHKNKVNSLLMEKWGYGKKDEAIEEASEEVLGSPGGDSKFSCGMKGGKWEEPDGPCIFAEAIDEVIQEGELDEGFLDRIKHAVTSTDNPGGYMPWSDAESREMDEEGVPLHPTIVRMYKRDKPGFRGERRGWTGKYPPGFWDEDDGAARYAAYQKAGLLGKRLQPGQEKRSFLPDIIDTLEEGSLDEMQGHPGKCCDMAHPDEEHEDYMARITIRLAEDGTESMATTKTKGTVKDEAGEKGESDVEKMLVLLPKINNKVEFEQLVAAVVNHAENIMGSKTPLKKLYKSLPKIVKTKGK